MSRSDRLQYKPRLNYAELNNGLLSTAPGKVCSDSVQPLDAVSSMSTEPPANPDHDAEINVNDDDLDAEIAELEIIERGLEAKNHRRERLARRDELVKRIQRLEAVEVSQPSGSAAAQSSLHGETLVDPLPVPVKQNDVSLKDLRNLT